jgi:hypothetical protein
VALGVADALSLGVADGEAVAAESNSAEVEVLLGVALSVGVLLGVLLGVLDVTAGSDGVGPAVDSAAVSAIEVGTQSSAEPSVGAATVGSALASGVSVGAVVSAGAVASDGSGADDGELVPDWVSPEVRSVSGAALSPGVGVSVGAGVSRGLGVGATHGALLFSVGTGDAVGVGLGDALPDGPALGDDEGAGDSAGTALVSSNTGAPMVRAFSAATRSPAPSRAAARTTTGALSNNWLDSPALTASGSAPPTTVAQSAGRCRAAATPWSDSPCWLPSAPLPLPPPQPASVSAIAAHTAAARRRTALPDADPPDVDTQPPAL